MVSVLLEMLSQYLATVINWGTFRTQSIIDDGVFWKNWQCFLAVDFFVTKAIGLIFRQALKFASNPNTVTFSTQNSLSKLFLLIITIKRKIWVMRSYFWQWHTLWQEISRYEKTVKDIHQKDYVKNTAGRSRTI